MAVESKSLYVARVSPSLVAEGAPAELQGLREGSISSVDFLQRLIIAGRGYVANMGSVTTPLTFLATAANRPDAWVRVPTGTTIFPLRVTVALESMAGTVTEIDVRMAQNDIGNGSSSAASVGPLNLRTDALVTSNCVARQLATADTTAETNPVSLWRRTYASAGAAGSEPNGAEVAMEAMGYPMLVGPASLVIFVAATTTQATGFVVIQYVETPSSWWTL